MLSLEAPADPCDSYVTFTTGTFSRSNCAGVVNDSHFVTRDRMGRTMAFLGRAGAATLFGEDAYVVLAVRRSTPCGW
ncbi:hypothetical protein [Streptomyces sp. NPDC003717]|uniref:hypothetical protein n=1 Tax=Streptomyces sp. NPDC003717 TaxID=3154276 RepID=UPI0033B2E2AD